jgi:hypothetical protein
MPKCSPSAIAASLSRRTTRSVTMATTACRSSRVAPTTWSPCPKSPVCYPTRRQVSIGERVEFVTFTLSDET